MLKKLAKRCKILSSSQFSTGTQQTSDKDEFKCPEEFGYYKHPKDCSKYYVCVFGGPLLESCTGGLMYRYVIII